MGGGTGFARSQSVEDGPFTEEFQAYVEHLMDHYHVPSVSFGIVDGNNTYIKCFGHANLSDSKEATENTLHFIASCTKSFTATTLLSVLEDHNAALDGTQEPVTLKTKIRDLIPADFQMPDEYATAHATLEDALSHRLGFGPHDWSYGGDGYTLIEAVRSLRYLAMTAEFRDKFQYLNLGYMLLQHVIEELTGQWIGVSHHKHIWDPLGMTSTYIRQDDAKKADNLLATPYTWDPIPQRLSETQYAADGNLVGGGGIISSIKDFTAYLRAVLHKNLPLDPSQQDELFQPRTISGKATIKHYSTKLYCLGWGTSTYRGRRVVDHSGGISGFTSKLLFLPEQKWGVAVLSNSDVTATYVHEAAILRLMDTHLRVPKHDRQDLVPLYDKKLQQQVDLYLNTRNRLFPTVPQPPIRASLPLSSYAGLYHNAGYRHIELTVAQPPTTPPVAPHTKEVLHADIRRLLNGTFDLEHVSGEHFIAWQDTEKSSALVRGASRARFVVGSDGKVKKLGIDMDPQEDADGMVVWFDRMG